MTFADYIDALRLTFPLLSVENCRLTSPADDGYNCIAWAADDTEHWWWPDAQKQVYWPPSAPRNETVEAFEIAFRGLGYSDRTDDSLEPGKQKIAIFASQRGAPTHAARQLPDGWWASKLGQEIDIEHELTAVEGPTYGIVAVVLARRAIKS